MHSFPQLVPGFYLQLRAAKAQLAEESHIITETANQLLQPLGEPTNPFANLPVARLHEIEKTALNCANLFQRSSSCVEGRNGQLALRHHHLHKISSRMLQSLTVIHTTLPREQMGQQLLSDFLEINPGIFLRGYWIGLMYQRGQPRNVQNL